MASEPAFFRHIIFFFFLSCTTTILSAAATPCSSSPPSSSPTYNSTSTTRDLMKGAGGWRSCFGGLRRNCKGNDNRHSVGSEVAYVDGPGFFTANFSIGTPPVEFVVVLDTTHDLTWVDCKFRPNQPQMLTPIFDPNKSSTYNIIREDSKWCKALKRERYLLCNPTYPCTFSEWYSSTPRFWAVGELSSETLSFDGGKIKFPDLTFGCSSSKSNASQSVGGVIGLGRGPLSLVSQLGSSVGNKFSYCLVSDPSRATSTLRFGDHRNGSSFPAIERLQRTPFGRNPKSLPSFYYLNLEDISVNNKRLNISTKTARELKADTGFIIATASPYTWLAPEIFAKLEFAFKFVIPKRVKRRVKDTDLLCYELDRSAPVEDQKAWPSLTFHFEGGADWLVLPQDLFWFMEESGMVCCTFGPSNNAQSVFGNKMQRNFHVEYDLRRSELSFARTDCSAASAGRAHKSNNSPTDVSPTRKPAKPEVSVTVLEDGRRSHKVELLDSLSVCRNRDQAQAVLRCRGVHSRCSKEKSLSSSQSPHNQVSSFGLSLLLCEIERGG